MSDTEVLSNKLSAARDNYRKSLREVRANAEKEIDNIRNTSEIRENNQKEAYKKDKAMLENENKQTVDQYVKQTTERMEAATKKYRDDVKDMQTKHDRERYVETQNINEKLNRISDQYRTRQGLTEARNADLLSQSKKSMDDRMKKDAINLQKEREAFTETTQNKMRDFLDKQSKEIKTVSDRHQKNILENNEYNLRDKNRVKNSLNDYIDELKADRTAERELLLKDRKEAIARGEKAKALERGRLEKEFAGTIDNLSGKAEADRARTERNLLNQLKFERKQFQDSSRKSTNIVNDMVETAKTNNQIHENQMKNAKAKMDMIRKMATGDVIKNQREFNERYEKLDIKHQKARTDEKTRLLADSRQKYNELLNNKIESVNKEKRDGRIMLNRYQQQLRGLARDTDLKIFENNQETKKLLRTNNERHYKMVNKMTERSQDALADYKEQVHEEKSKLIEQTRDRVAETGLSLRKYYETKMGAMSDTHSSKMEKMQETLDDTIRKYETLLRDNQLRNAEMFDEFQRIAQTEQKLQKQEFNQQVKDKEAQFKYNLDGTRRTYEGKLSEAKDQAELRIMELTNRYENEIATERKNFYRVLKQKMTESQRSLQSLSMRMDAEKKALRTQMESRITDLQNENRKIRQLNVQRREYLEKIEADDVS
jgi:hypothetical protein